MENIDEIRLKNAINCQALRGARACDFCPYSAGDGKCDTVKIAKDSLNLIYDLEAKVTTLRKTLNSIYVKDGLYLKEDI